MADQVNNRVPVFTTSGAFLRSWGSLGSLPGQFGQPQWVATDVLGSVFVTDGRNNRVQQFTRTGGFETDRRALVVTGGLRDASSPAGRRVLPSPGGIRSCRRGVRDPLDSLRGA